MWDSKTFCIPEAKGLTDFTHLQEEVGGHSFLYLPASSGCRLYPIWLEREGITLLKGTQSQWVLLNNLVLACSRIKI